jgi:hypothetical protein
MNDRPHDQKRQSQPMLSVDFVTALTLDECRALLQQVEPGKGQYVSLWDDHSFTVHCCGPDQEQAVARFWGTLEPREHGTWVWGTTIEEAHDKPEWPSRRTTVLLIALIILGAAVITSRDMRLILVGAVLITASLVWRFWTWQRRHREALRVIGWVWETLYVPIKEVRADETQTQA